MALPSASSLLMAFWTMGPKVTFSSTVNHGNSAPFWKTTIRSEPGCACLSAEQSTSPSRRISPLLMLWKPAMAFRRVVLPHPEGPTTTQNSPGAMSMVQRSTARTLAPSGSYILLTLLIWMCPRVGVSLPLIVLPP